MEESMVKSNETEGMESGTVKDPVQESNEKLFTQEQVNDIIKKRLKNQKESENSMQELNARAAELTARESRLNCKEYLIDKGYSSELLDIIDTSDVETFIKKADRLDAMYRREHQEVAPLASTEGYCGDSVAEAFDNTKHTPKVKPSTWEPFKSTY